MFVSQEPFIDYSSGVSAAEWTQKVQRKTRWWSRCARMPGLSRKFDKAEDAVVQLKLEDFGWQASR